MAELHHLIESLDSLWFFSTVFHDEPSSIPAAEPEKQSSHAKLVTIPCSPEEETKTTPPPAEAAAEVRVELVVFVSKPETASERRKRLARRWRSRKKAMILREIDLLCFDNFYYKNLHGGFSSAAWVYGYPTTMMSQKMSAAERRKKMTPLNDSLEVKRQIKPWAAHAVACTVK